METQTFLCIQEALSKYNFNLFEYYTKLQCILQKINSDTKENDIIHIVHNICRKGNKTYVDMKNCTGFSAFFPSGFSYKRDNFYSQIFGYVPHRIQLPKLIDMVKAYSQCLPPPNTKNDQFWNHFDLKQHKNKNAIITSIVQNNTREFVIFDATEMLEWSSINDKSLSEIFSGDLYCCALTLDIDGKTIDVKQFGITSSYPINEILNELQISFCNIFYTHSCGRWNVNKYPPTYHVWIPENKNETKLSMRISVHFPTNVCYLNINELQRCVNDLCEILCNSVGRYLIVRYINVNDDVRFEKSNIDCQWYCLPADDDAKNNTRINIKDYIQDKDIIKINSKTQTFLIERIQNELYVQENNSKLKIHCLDGWMTCKIEKDSFVECLIDKSIYSENKSLRLPTQSKIENGKKLRKFVPFTKESTIIDALVHYPHEDCKPCGNNFVVIGNEKPKIEKEIVCTTTIEENEIIRIIKKKYCMETGSIKKIGQQRLCLNIVDCEKGKHFCLIKNDVHKSSKMYFVYDEVKTILYISCFSIMCQQQIKELGHKKCIPLLQLNCKSKYFIQKT